jgi:hypothetical protein
VAALHQFHGIDEVLGDRPTFDESSPVDVNDLGDFSLQPCCQHFLENLHGEVLQADGAKVTGASSRLMFGQHDNKRAIGALQICSLIVDTTGTRGIAVRPRRTEKAIKRTAKVLPCVFLENARQRAHGSKLHGKRTLSCAFYRHARQTLQKKIKKGKSLPDGCSGHPIVTEKIKKQRLEASPLSPPPTAPAIRRGKEWAGRAVPPRSACCRAP